MGLAASQVRLLTLTARKADCEYGISMNSMEKMALTRESSALAKEYYSKLQSKNISYYANGKYNKINYAYLMGYGQDYSSIWENYPLKNDKSMVLTDYKGQVVLSDVYANAITSVLGASAMNASGQGSTFSQEKIAEIMAALCTGFTAQDFQTVIDGEQLTDTYNAKPVNTLSGMQTGETVSVDISENRTAQVRALIDFYYPIFTAAATNGWTTEYNKAMSENDNYISDALISGSFQIESTDSAGNYDEGTSLTYYVTAGSLETRTDSDIREEITAWYDAEKERITEKENFLDMEMKEWSTELEAINTEIQSIQSLIDDAISSVFDWGGN